MPTEQGCRERVPAAVILLERLAVRGPWLSRLVGAALIAWAVLRLPT